MAALLALLISGAAAVAAGGRPSPHGAPGQKSLCLDCHDPHQALFSRVLRFPAGDETCWACHSDTTGLPFRRADYEASPHFLGLGGPVPSASTCVGCHQPHGRAAGPKLLRVDWTNAQAYGVVNSACGACHPGRLPDRTGKKSFTSLSVYRQVRHADPRLGAVWPSTKSTPGQCTACHNPHGAPNPSLLREPRTAVCYPCHPMPEQGKSLWTGEKSFRRSAHREVCLECHNPHGTINPQTGTVYPKALVDEGAALCFRCHAGLRQRFAESQTASTASGIRSRHPADQPGSTIRCVSCHNPHQIRAKMPGGADPILTDPDTGKLFAWLGGNASQEFCLKCHDGSWPGAADIAAEAAKAQTVVSGFVWAGKGINLHYVHLSRYHKQKCSGCHDPHATSGPAGINRGHLLEGLTLTAYRGGYPGYEACATDCHHVRCASCHPAPPDWRRAPGP